MKEEFEVKSEEVLKIIENYRDKLDITRFYLKFDDTYDKRYILRIIFKCDYKRYNYENIDDGEITVDFTKEKNIIKLGNWVSRVSNSGLVFNSLSKIKLMIEMIEKLQKIEYMKLPEFKEYVALKDKQKELEEQKEKLEKELAKQKEEIENKLKELRKEEK